MYLLKTNNFAHWYTKRALICACINKNKIKYKFNVSSTQLNNSMQKHEKIVQTSEHIYHRILYVLLITDNNNKSLVNLIIGNSIFLQI